MAPWRAGTPSSSRSPTRPSPPSRPSSTCCALSTSPETKMAARARRNYPYPGPSRGPPRPPRPFWRFIHPGASLEQVQETSAQALPLVRLSTLLLAGVGLSLRQGQLERAIRATETLQILGARLQRQPALVYELLGTAVPRNSLRALHWLVASAAVSTAALRKP